MSGAIVGAVVAVVAWLGLWAYLMVMNRRLADALRELERAPEGGGTPTVTVTETEHNDE